MIGIDMQECLELGYDRLIFENYEKEDFIIGSWTYRDFIRDGVDFMVVFKSVTTPRGKVSETYNLIRKQNGLHLRKGGMI